MDETHLAKLIREAMAAFNDFIRAHPFQDEAVSVLRPDKSGTLYQSLSRPRLSDAVFSYHTERMELPSAQALVVYLWEHGGHRLTLTRDNGDPDRADWASNAFHMLVATPLLRQWDEHSIRSLSSTGVWQPWEVPDHELDQVASDIAAIEVGKGAKVKITVPLLQLTFADTKELVLEPGIIVRLWTQEEKAVYLHKNGNIYPFDDAFGPYNSDSYIEIVANAPEIFKPGKKPDIALEDFVGSIVGRIKWAIMQTTNPTQLIRELPATTEVQQSVFGFFPIRRQAVQRVRSRETTLHAESCRSATKLWGMLKTALDAYPDLRDVVWMLDRATLAVLPRDVLLESVIGLERLLVSGSGENLRRFKTYGAALIGGDRPGATAKRLSEIYSLRSSAAHGADADPKRFEEFSVIARTYLAAAIANVVRLIVSSIIRPETGEHINRSIERYLTSRVYGSAQEDLNRAEKY